MSGRTIDREDAVERCADVLRHKAKIDADRAREAVQRLFDRLQEDYRRSGGNGELPPARKMQGVMIMIAGYDTLSNDLRREAGLPEREEN